MLPHRSHSANFMDLYINPIYRARVTFSNFGIAQNRCFGSCWSRIKRVLSNENIVPSSLSWWKVSDGKPVRSHPEAQRTRRASDRGALRRRGWCIPYIVVPRRSAKDPHQRRGSSNLRVLVDIGQPATAVFGYALKDTCEHG